LDAAGAYYADLSFIKPADVRRLMGRAPDRDPSSSPVYAAVTDAYRRCPSRDAVQRACYADLKIYLPNDPLVKVDRMSMAHSLEIRCPLLDRRVVELAFRIPARQKQQGRTGKALLRQLARRRLPGGLWQLPKRGFTAPMGEWLATDSASMFQDEVLGGHSHVENLLDTKDLRRQFDEHRRGGRDHGYSLWAVWVLERWLNTDDTFTRRLHTPTRPTDSQIQAAVASNA
jgi:asparagine synthase (glutamine-hydrolysing)